MTDYKALREVAEKAKLPELLRQTTEHVAVVASMPFTLWNEHSNACLDAANEITRLRTALAASEAKLLNVRQILAGTDVGSLPNDYPIERLALETWNTLQERTLEGLALIGRAEAAEAKLEKAREALTFVVKCSPVEWSSGDERYIQMFERAATTLKDIA